MKLHHPGLRTSLSISTIDKLCLIHVCRRVLDRERTRGYKRTIYDLTEEEEIQLEDTLTEIDCIETTTGLKETEEGPIITQLREGSQARKRAWNEIHDEV